MKNLSAVLFTFIVMLTFLIRCDSDGSAVVKTFVLVHGAWQAPYVWQEVKTQLEAKDQRVVMVELPAHGTDNTLPAMVSIESYRDKVVKEINTINGPVILIGHSMGGVVISAVAENIPAKIEKLIYIGAFVPANNQSLLELASTDTQSQLGPSLIPSEDQLTLNVKDENIVAIFCQDAPTGKQQLMISNYKAEPSIPFTNKVELTADKFGKTDRYYIHTTEDHAIGLDLQNRMAAAASITKKYSINTGHSPFLSNPAEVTRLLLEIGI